MHRILSITVQNHTRICLWETRWHRNWLLVGRSGKWNNGVEDFYAPQVDDRDSLPLSTFFLEVKFEM